MPCDLTLKLTEFAKNAGREYGGYKKTELLNNYGETDYFGVYKLLMRKKYLIVINVNFNSTGYFFVLENKN